LIGFFTLLIAAFFIAPILVVAVHNPPAPHAGPFDTLGKYPHWIVPYCLAIYPLSMFAATFCNVAFYSQVIVALNGGEISLRSGLAVAASRIKSILVWSLFGGLIGGLIREIESRLGIFGRIIMGMVGLAWSVACVFVIPVIIREEPTANPLDILKKSAGTIKRSWGEMLTGYLGLGVANLLFFSSSLVALVAAVVLAVVLSSVWLGLLAGAIWLLALVTYSCIANLASQTYLCALYIYASEGTIPEPYDQGLLDQAWKVKKT
jgi:hypothetical protein